MESRYIFLIKNYFKKTFLEMFYALGKKLLNIWICKHHKAKKIGYLYSNLIILYKSHINTSKNDIKTILFNIPNDFF